ncbi:uncharacterized protein COLE_07783 [Cutaneotrichosporon oleaginosum]|uniref:uncharacterized protein n=1 Tax=Cutaneotrichosporon oleaginosum TaxID=879819 RepID=UPI0013283482|nr:hypothetical protein COLE_07783 [Cutaneotrichosporon oleaginosum]
MTYCFSEAKDKLWVRGIVAAVAAMSCLLTGFNWFYASHLFVYHFGVSGQQCSTDGRAWFPFIDAVTMSFTQAFFAHRAYRLCDRKIWIPISVLLCILIEISACIATRIVFGQLNTQQDSVRVQGTTIIWMAASMVGDSIITGCILFGLVRSRTGIRQTKEIARLIRMTLEAQVPATLVALTLMIEVIIEPANMLGNCIILFQSKIYVVGFFYSLNARQRLLPSNQGVTLGDVRDIDPIVFNEHRVATIIVDEETEMHVTVSPVLLVADRSARPHRTCASTGRRVTSARSPRVPRPSRRTSGRQSTRPRRTARSRWGQVRRLITLPFKAHVGMCEAVI